MNESSNLEPATLRLPRVMTRCVDLDPHIWGYADRPEMEAAFAESVHSDGHIHYPQEAPPGPA